MKCLVLLSIIASTSLVPWNGVHGQASNQVDNIASSLINQLNTLSRQISAIQGVATDLSRNLAGMFQTGSRLVQGLQAENQSTNESPDRGWSGITSQFVDQTMQNPLVVLMVNQVNQIQRALTDIGSQVQRMIDSGTRIITGAPHSDAFADALWYQDASQSPTTTTPAPPPATNTGSGSASNTGTTTTATTSTDTHGISQTQTVTGPAASAAGQASQSANSASVNGAQILTRTIELANQQMSQTQRVLQEVTHQVSSLLATGSRIVVGNRGPSPIETVLDVMQTVSREFDAVQNLLRQVNDQFNRIIITSTRTILGTDGLPNQVPRQYANEERNGLSEVVVTGLTELADQLERLQQAFTSLANEVSAFAARTTNRILPSHEKTHLNTHKRVKRADALVVNGLQRAAGEITQNLGALGGTLARIAGGMTGIRIPSVGESDNRGIIDDSQRAFSGLNPIGVIGRGVGNIANSLQRIVPNVGRR